jgi:hypothetical protein
MEKQDMQQITEFLLYGAGPKGLLDHRKARQEQTAAMREEREADPKAWEERVATMRSRRITVRPEEMSADMKARLEGIAAMTDKIWAARREMRNASHKETVAENKPKTEDDGLPRNGGASKRRRANLSGQETGGGRATRGPRR